MNERIKELSNKAVLTASATYANGPDAIWLKEYNKMFAELIVRECMYIGRMAQINNQLVDSEIKDHFEDEE